MSMSIIVTLNAGSISDDFQLPADMPLKELSSLLMNGLKSMSPAEFKDKKHLLLVYKQQGLLNMSKTLSEYGVYDGAILDVVFVEEYYV